MVGLQILQGVNFEVLIASNPTNLLETFSTIRHELK
ncbi:hypothetical protein KAOT1_01300 [Kordia algicida OT-1]|uniref:Uncharacterized protein n=1 Tax=Kordia algicida OT-1 TaxID=391587 RepID=A9E8V7_9FLAO|nr:hypothetical protein KAOT1_01300 [Kordia algicida OT-1]